MDISDFIIIKDSKESKKIDYSYVRSYTSEDNYVNSTVSKNKYVN